MTRPNFRSAFVVLALALLATSGAWAAAETNATSGLTAQGPGLAVHGYDVVAYFTSGEPALGHAAHSTVHNGATYRFANQANLDTFTQNPDRYAPKFGGYCAYGVAVGAKFDGDPLLWRIVDGALYLNLNEDIRATWEKDVPGNIAKAEKQWREIAGKAPSALK